MLFETSVGIAVVASLVLRTSDAVPFPDVADVKGAGSCKIYKELAPILGVSNADEVVRARIEGAGLDAAPVPGAPGSLGS